MKTLPTTKLGQQIHDFQKAILPGLSVDCVVLGFQRNKLHVLLLKWKFKDAWSLPGGFIRTDEHLDQAAFRVLKDRTGLDDVFLRQFHTFGDMNRRPAGGLTDQIRDMLPASDRPFVAWLEQRFITTGYFALIDIAKARTTPDQFSESCNWLPIDQIPQLIQDHNEILNVALDQIRNQLNYLPFGNALLPPQFTLGELRNLYESILGKSLDRGNFQRKMLRIGHLVRMEKKKAGTAHRAPYLYQFDQEVYQDLVQKGIGYL